MRIGIDASRAFIPQRTGTEEYAYQLIKHLMQLPQAKNHEWILYTRSNPSDFSGLKHVRFQVIKQHRLWTQVGLASRTWIDSLDCLWIPAHTLPVLRKPGLRTIVTIHGIEYEYLPAFENKLQSWYLPLSTWYAVRSSNQVIAVSEFTRGQIISRLQGSPNKITVIHEGVDTANSISDRSRGLQTLSRFGLSPNKYLLFIGTIQPRKNLERLVNVYHNLRTDNKISLNIKLVLCGKWGWNFENLQEEIRVKDLTNSVICTDYVSDTEKRDLLNYSSLYIQPSITEGFGLPILEAFEAGVLVVSSNGGALPEVVGNAGLLFDPTDESQMAEAIVQGLTNGKLRKELVAKGHRQLTKFSWQKAAEKTYSILINK